MKYSLFTVSAPEMMPEQALAKMKEYGYDGVDWRVARLPEDPQILNEAPSYWRNNLCTIDIDTIEERAEELATLTGKYGLETNCLATYLNCAENPAQVESCMRAAQIMGCKKVRVNAPGYDKAKGYQRLFAESLQGLAQIERLAKKYQVKAVLEMHMGNIIPTASAAKALVSWFDPSAIGVIYDTGNVIYEGFEEYQMAFEILGPYLDLVHIKNAKWTKQTAEGKEKYLPGWAPMRDGFADFERCFRALKACGYNGYVTFEDFSEGSSEEKMQDDIRYIRQIEASVYGEEAEHE